MIKYDKMQKGGLYITPVKLMKDCHVATLAKSCYNLGNHEIAWKPKYL